MSDRSLAVTVVHSPAPRVVREVELALAFCATVRQAIVASHVLAGLSEAEVAALECGVWGRKVKLDHGLRDGDRVELYRPLRVDPKEARRLRFSGQGSKVAGLFRRKRPGSKSGY